MVVDPVLLKLFLTLWSHARNKTHISNISRYLHKTWNCHVAQLRVILVIFSLTFVQVVFAFKKRNLHFSRRESHFWRIKYCKRKVESLDSFIKERLQQKWLFPLKPSVSFINMDIRNNNSKRYFRFQQENFRHKNPNISKIQNIFWKFHYI